jgi:hypothetical protein
MTEHYTSEGYMQDAPQEYDGESYLGEPIPTFNLSEDAAPEYGACMTWTIPQAGIGTPVQIFQRRIRRHKGKMILTTITGATGIVINSKIDPLQGASPQGATLVTIGNLPDWESQQPLYAIAIGGTAVIACWDEAYAER